MSNPTRTAIWLLSHLLGTACPCAVALNPALDVGQYAHAAWRISEGFPGGHIVAIAQTPDGYLWLGGDQGLFRFDGTRVMPWQPPATTSLPDTRIASLLVGHDGTLWIGTYGGLVSWKQGRLDSYRESEGTVSWALAEGQNGEVWVGGLALSTRPLGPLCQIGATKNTCYGSDGRLGAGVSALSRASDGVLWVGAENGLWRLQDGSLQPYPLPEPVAPGIGYVTTTRTEGVLVLTRKGIRQLLEGQTKSYWTAPEEGRWVGRSLFSDRDGGVWFGITGKGLIHLHQGRMDEFGLTDGLSGDKVYKIFEDREGDIWVATSGGLDRFHALSATTYGPRQGLVGVTYAVLADRDGTVWFSTDHGLYHWQGDHFELYRPAHGRSHQSVQESQRTGLVREVTVTGLPNPPGGSLLQDHSGRVWLGAEGGFGYLAGGRFVRAGGVPDGYVDAIVEEPPDHLWVAHRNAGLLELASSQLVRQIPWTRISASRTPSRLIVDSIRGGLWLGFFGGGIVHVADGEVDASFGERDGLARGPVSDLQIAPDGAVWAAAAGGVSRLQAGRIATIDTRVGLPCNSVDSLLFDEGSLWLYGGCGLVHVPAAEVESWSRSALQGSVRDLKIRTSVLGAADGVGQFASISTFSPHLAKSEDGKLWLVSVDGLTVFDSRHRTINQLTPPVHIERLTVDHQSYQAASSLRLPPQPHDVEFAYTALSLVEPGKVMFRYRLVGRDVDWQEAGNRRSAFYTDLPPGAYRFRVIASNNSGVWNEQGAALALTIAPAYWQTNWFRALCALAFVGLLWALYQLRLRQLARAFDMTLEARVGERTRIARELHDTLLQSFQGLLLRLQTVAELLPARPADAKRVAASTADQAAQAIRDGRDAVQGLRASAVESADLALELRTAGELAASEAGKETVDYRVEVEGTPRALKAIVRDEIYRIAGEALRNAFRHAEPTHIEVELRYDERQLRLRVRDDGKGIEQGVVQESGSDAHGDHHGLRGMRERAGLIGGTITLWSAPKSGTEVELVVPASRAYARSQPARGSSILERFTRKSAQRVS